ncbi:MAG: biotin--[acetyl-CoA-carboxylase] ligase [Peptococcaceae bacterium]|nr:biotin--[acetyl-CoA-carboxylase] ligase [Peptococcaceae bacterium]
MKHTILALLQQHSGTFLSGADISRRLGVSRASVWKDITALRQEGFTIEAATNRGYRLTDGPTFLHTTEVLRLLTTKHMGRAFTLDDKVDSTNRRALSAAEAGAPDGAVFATLEQTEGRGRMGRPWYSPTHADASLMMSVLLRPRTPVVNAAQITLVAGLAVYQGIEDLLTDPPDSMSSPIPSYSPIPSSSPEPATPKTGIKWPNDIIINGKKTAGILTELVAEIEHIKAIAVGIGINAQIMRFPPELNDSATSLSLETGRTYSLNGLAASVLNRFEPLYDRFLENGFLSDILPIYQKNCVTLGQDIKAVYNNKEIYGRAVTINARGELIIRLATGSDTALNSSEVSVRGLMGYT